MDFVQLKENSNDAKTWFQSKTVDALVQNKNLSSTNSLCSSLSLVYASVCMQMLLFRVELLQFHLMISLTPLIISRFLRLLADFSISSIQGFDMISRHRYLYPRATTSRHKKSPAKETERDEFWNNSNILFFHPIITNIFLRDWLNERRKSNRNKSFLYCATQWNACREKNLKTVCEFLFLDKDKTRQHLIEFDWWWRRSRRRKEVFISRRKSTENYL